jgi:hypothetical protein
MKKILYLPALAVVTSVVVSSCTEEVVTPRTEETSNTGGTPGDPIKP